MINTRLQELLHKLQEWIDQIGNLEKNQSGTYKSTYTFEDKETGEVFDKLMKISEKEQYLKDNPNLKPVLTNS